jgi:hypothetical protein
MLKLCLFDLDQALLNTDDIKELRRHPSEKDTSSTEF